ncbi:S8 family serine peptidase, partial [Cognatishimia sp. F0-27]|uniref:S8 family serine peptidase n=1 Tax=Cognatishimia sp. F0-27 TaxID=2816855 RepID=UPI001D0CA5A3
MAFIPTDPLFGQQLHLLNNNAGQLDLNVVDVWDDYSGDGVQVAVHEDGIDLLHPDLAAQLLTTIDYDYTNNDFDPSATLGDPSSGDHGVAVTGIIGAQQGNNLGGVGVAWGVEMVVYRGYGAAGGENIYDSAGLGDGLPTDGGPGNTNGNDNGSDIINKSAGFGANVFIARTAQQEALAEIAEFGREGLGTLFVKSSGNSRAGANSSSREEGTAEAEDTVQHSINVAALRADGWVTFSSTPGANLLVSAFSHGLNNSGNITTTDRIGTNGYNTNTTPNGGDYVSTFSGTSAAAPQVAGVTALVLEANPNLGWRDVHDILAYSARHVGSAVGTAANTGAPTGSGFEQATQLDGSSWFWNDAKTWNGGALHFSNDYGFGLVDALAAVRLAETWDRHSTTANQTTGEIDLDFTPLTVTNSFVSQSASLDVDMVIEYVTVNIDFTIDDLADAEIFLLSPQGTRVQLLNDTGDTQSFSTGGGGWDFGTNAFRGTVNLGASDPTNTGDWQIQFRNDDGASNGSFVVNDVDITFTGRAVGGNDLFVFTDEYSNYAAGSEHVTSFSGNLASSARATLNTAAVTSNTVLNMQSNTGLIDGVAMMATFIDRIYTGDGNDTITGDSFTNFLHSGRGNDSIVGGSSAGETINGGPGNDTIDGGAGDDVLIDGVFQSSEGVDSLNGGADDDLIIVDWVTTGNVYEGSLGNDTVDTSVDNTSVNIDLSTPSFTSFGSTFSGFENAITGSGTNSLTGSDLANLLIAGRGNDTIDGLGGNDTIIGDDLPFGMLGVNLDGNTDQYFEAEPLTEMPTGVFTVEWLYRSEAAPSSGIPFVSYAVTNSTNEFLVFGGTNGNISVFVNGFALDTGIATTSVQDGDVHRISVSLNTGAGPNGRVSLYIDGVEEFRGQGPNTAFGTPLSPGGTFIIGQEQDGSTPGTAFDPTQIAQGTIGDIRIWSIEREQADIDATQFTQFDALDLPANPALVANWQVNTDTRSFDALVGATALTMDSPDGNPFKFERYSHDGGNDTIDGGSGADLIFGGSGTDTINGDGDNDTILGGAGADSLTGGTDTDALSYDGSTGGVIVNLTANTATTFNGLSSHAAGDTISGFADLIGSDYDDRLAGDAGANNIVAGQGDDILDDTAGADTLRGEAGDDGFQVDAADDAPGKVYDGGDGMDRINFFGTGAGSTVDFTDDTVTGIEELRFLSTVAPFNGGGTVFFNASQVAGFALFEKSGVTAAATVDITMDQATLDLGGITVTGFTAIDRFIITGQSVVETIVGTTQNDSINTGGGDDSIAANDGDDIVETGLGISDLDGGTGEDTVSFATATDAVTASFQSRGFAFAGAPAILGEIVAFEHIVGSAFDDVLDLSDTNPVGLDPTVVKSALGGAGNDFLGGSSNDDLLEGGNDNDTLAGRGGVDTLLGGQGMDEFQYLSGISALDASDSIEGGTGEDILYIGAFTAQTSAVDLRGASLTSIEMLRMQNDSSDAVVQLNASQFGTGLAFDAQVTNQSQGTFNSRVEVFLDTPGFFDLSDITLINWGADDRILITGSGSDDNIIGTSGNDSVEGGGGNDALHDTLGADTLRGGDNDDGFQVAAPANGVGEVYDGGAGFNTINLFGNGPTSVFDFRDDTLTSIDEIRFLSSAAPFEGGGTLQLLSSQFQAIANYERVGGSGEAIIDVAMDTTNVNLLNATYTGFLATDSFAVRGSGNDDTIVGSVRNDTLEGNGGNDLIFGAAGDDTIDGGGDTDTVSYNLSLVGVTVDLRDGAATGEGTDMLSSIEAVRGSLSADRLSGSNNTDERLEGMGGNDTLAGRGGNDTLMGGDDSDLLLADSGDDSMDGGAQTDTVSFAFVAASVRANLEGGTATSTLSGADTLVDIENLIGSRERDIVYGSRNVGNHIDGGGGNDLIFGLSGEDTLIGGAGDDDIAGGDHADSLLGGEGEDTLSGNSGDDSLEGGENNDTLLGGADSDTLIGGAGEDRL